MAKSVPVHCPTCRREHSFTPPTFPCACGAPLTVPVLPDADPELLAHRTWRDSWVAVRCPACDRQGQWPRPEFGCSCGAVVRLPVQPSCDVAPRGPDDDGSRRGAVTPPPFRPVAIRTERDAVMAAERYLRWLGFTGVRRPGSCPAPAASGVDLRAEGLVVRVDPTTLPTTLRDVECLWLHGLLESSDSACFSLAGYAGDARTRADDLRLPLFVLDLTGLPRALNDWADELVRRGRG
ncbi:hypothetical protein BLA24_32020 [Streptomyces cinnamoneus]|uniref:Restriction endonuclease type IV Mrr domain-containing protein n=1 Tax=Streptomyces cinnamoneus TaxID=53446 RepID=A0A2G1XA28_STRCJ|nr:hypothetical protein [Streptomyces cinnamoneus]PHQ48073.1 hypothetical protein BLA24_32020 [Streptomyces cinnamoneus]PPT15699.1 hypothetical protein CYQ11_25075 [Streptomyces cinnamoneus]